MNIVVLAGGLSPERDVSLTSGCLIANALIKRGHKVLLLDLYLGLKDTSTFDMAYDKYAKDTYSFKIADKEPDLERLKEETGYEDLVGPNVISICKSADITFMALHGSVGENGQIQAMFDLLNVKYTGTGYIGSLLAMNKAVSKEIMTHHGILTPEWIVCSINDRKEPPYLPCVIKPVSCGSSIGVSIVETKEEYEKAIAYASTYESEILIEKKVVGREFSIGIMDNQPLPEIEIIPNSGFYDYKNKYQSGLTKEICPANIDDQLRKELKEKALKVHKALKLGTYSRIDFIVDSTGGIYCLEANTLPGMTPNSLLPQEAQAINISYEDLCERIVLLSYNSKR